MLRGHAAHPAAAAGDDRDLVRRVASSLPHRVVERKSSARLSPRAARGIALDDPRGRREPAVVPSASAGRASLPGSTTRRSRPASRSARPRSLAATRTTRRSAGSGSRSTRSASAIAATSLVIVGGVTPSMVARDPIVRGPPNTRTDSADNRGAETPVARSSCARRRKRWSVAECSRAANSASGVATGAIERLY